MPNSPKPMSSHMFWWKHLDKQQQVFIIGKFKELAEKETEDKFAQFAYDNKEHLRLSPGWPETQMRKV